MSLIKLAERDLEVLAELEAACRLNAEFGREWQRPLDCGGVDGSDHSYRLSKLARRGLAEARERGDYSRGSRVYRITDAGRKALQVHSQIGGTYDGK